MLLKSLKSVPLSYSEMMILLFLAAFGALLARAHYKGADVLLMYEPTSSLDAKTEEEITETLGLLLSKKRTIIIVSDRESLLSKCDRIIDFEKHKEVIA